MALNCSAEFKSVIVQIICVAVCVCICFNHYNLGNHFPCLMGPEFHAYEASGSEEDFNIFLCVSMVQT